MVVLVIAATYVGALVATIQLRDDATRPLYDGFAPRPAYRFVDPPDFYAASNVEPEGVRARIPLGRDGSEPASVTTPDGQFVASFGRGAIPPRPRATRVAISIRPLAPRPNERLPEGLRPNGNLYRVRMRYEPTGEVINGFRRPGSLVIAIPEVGNRLFARNGARWSPIGADAIPPADLDLGGELNAPADYLAATDLPLLVGPNGDSTTSVVPIAIGVGAATLALVALGVVLRRRRRIAV